MRLPLDRTRNADEYGAAIGEVLGRGKMSVPPYNLRYAGHWVWLGGSMGEQIWKITGSKITHDTKWSRKHEVTSEFKDKSHDEMEELCFQIDEREREYERTAGVDVRWNSLREEKEEERQFYASIHGHSSRRAADMLEHARAAAYDISRSASASQSRGRAR